VQDRLGLQRPKVRGRRGEPGGGLTEFLLWGKQELVHRLLRGKIFQGEPKHDKLIPI